MREGGKPDVSYRVYFHSVRTPVDSSDYSAAVNVKSRSRHELFPAIP